MLCTIHSLTPPEELENLQVPEEFPAKEENSDTSEEEFMAEDDIEMEAKALEVTEDFKKITFENGMDLGPDKLLVLQKCSSNLTKENLKVRKRQGQSTGLKNFSI